MAVHIFITNEMNFNTCKERGIVAIGRSIPEGRTFDALLSRVGAIKEDDYILMYVMDKKQLHGVWKADGYPFYDETLIWEDGIYPFRCRIKTSEYEFDIPLKRDDITDLCNTGLLWTWAPKRPDGTANSMFSMSENEFNILIAEFLKLNPYKNNKWRIYSPVPYHTPNISNMIHINDKGKPSWEFSVMTLLVQAYNQHKYQNIFGNYNDFLSYVPTSLNTEMDFLLMFYHPAQKQVVLSYDIVEVKNDKFKIDGLKQLIGYESWFLQKKVSGDHKMLRTTAIAPSFSDEVIEYVNKRAEVEEKTIKLVQFTYSKASGLDLKKL